MNPPEGPAPAPALALLTGQALSLGTSLSVLRDGDDFVYFVFTLPVAAHARHDKLGRNLQLARLALMGLARQSDLAAAFGLSARTIGRAKQRLQQHGEGGFARPRKRRKRHGIVDPEVLDELAQRLQSGQSLYRAAKDLGVNVSTVWRYTQEGELPASQHAPRRAAAADVADAEAALAEPPLAVDPAVATAPALEAPAAPGKAERNRRDAQAPLGRAARDTAGRIAASLGQLDGQSPHFEPAAAVSCGGVLTALPALLEQGLLRHCGLLQLPKGFYGVPCLLLLWAMLLLARLRNAEALRYVQPGEWGALLGLDRCPCARTLRRRTGQLAQCAGLADWIAALSQQWSSDAPEEQATLFVDGHVQVYSGQGRLPKHFVPRQKLALPAAVGYWVHALGGAPLLCLHRQVDAGMVHELWHGIVPQLRQLGLLAEQPAPDAAPRLTLVFDREGWSPELFARLRAAGIAVVSWRKGKQAERWPESEFVPARIPLHTPLGAATLEGRVAEREVSLGTHGSVREIRFWGERRLRGTGKGGQARQPRELAGRPAETQRQPALVSTHPSLSAEQLAGLLRSRWTQENCFKYLRNEFGLDTLAEHALVDVEAATQIVNPAWRMLDKELTKARSQAGHLRRKHALQADPQAAQQLQARVEASEQTVAGLDYARRSVPQHIRADELSQDERLQALPAPLRQLLHTLRMLVYRAETAMAVVLAPQLDNPETARSLLKALFRSDASLLPDPAAGTLTVRLLHQASRAQDAALMPLLEELNQTRTVFPGTQLRLVYELPPTAPQPPLTGIPTKSHDSSNGTM